MKVFAKISLTLALVACISAPVCTVTASAATATGYTCAEDVDYVKSGKYIYNWGVRDEDCTFLSTYAQSFYTGSYVYSALSQQDGGTGRADAPQSALYSSLKTLMTSKQTYTTTYDATRELFRYTDCEANGNKISSFYSGKSIGPAWDGGSTWNREHTWPNSKGDASGKGENDIMMLRPTSTQENGGRGNKAYGESSGYYDPNSLGQELRGDCARIMLFVYTRWGNTYRMWGSDGVMESLPILLKWMEEDPVDTWEMGRNDAVQAITGTRNVFVDYPEYAWLLFGEELPKDMVTPSGEAKNGTPQKPDTSDSSTPETPETSETPENSAPSTNACEHSFGEWTQLPNGWYQRICTLCSQAEVKRSIETTSSCNSTLVSPFTVTVLLSGAYVFLRKKED